MSLRQGHELDAELAGANLFGWILPAIGLLFRCWPITLGGGVAAVIGEYLLGRLPWPLFERGWVAILHSVLSGLVYALVVVTAYRILAWKESSQTALGVNTASRALLVGAQVYVVWTVAILIVAGILMLMGIAVGAMLDRSAASAGSIIVGIFFGVLALPLLILLLSPLWAILSVAGALSTAHAVRSGENGFGAVLVSLRLSFDQKWRVFWPSYVIGLLIVGLLVLRWFVQVDDSLIYGPNGRYVLAAFTIASCAFGLAMTFVIERAYAPDLGLSWDGTDNAAATPPPAGVDPSTPAGAIAPTALAPAAAAGVASSASPAPATPSEIAAMIDQDLRSNQTRRLAELTERGLAADARFFVTHPDSTITLAKKLGQVERADLAVKVLSPFLKDHRAHRLHLSGALLAANLLAKDRKRLPEAARFLERVKALYPNEPMVDQLIRSTAKAIAAGIAWPR